MNQQQIDQLIIEWRNGDELAGMALRDITQEQGVEISPLGWTTLKTHYRDSYLYGLDDDEIASALLSALLAKDWPFFWAAYRHNRGCELPIAEHRFKGDLELRYAVHITYLQCTLAYLPITGEVYHLMPVKLAYEQAGMFVGIAQEAISSIQRRQHGN